MRNLEYKARIVAPQSIMATALALGADLWGDLRQTDTYFAVSHGRLKLRETVGRQGELIYYERDEAAADRPSDYTVAYIPDPAPVREALASAFGVLAVVKKRRTLLILDTARVHLDNVEGLGHFVEIEAPVKEDEAQTRQRLDSLLEALGLDCGDCIRSSYADLIGDQ